MQLDNNKEKLIKVRTYGMEYGFSEMRIDRRTAPKDRYQYEIADDDERQGKSSRVRKNVMINFLGTVISDVPFLE